MHFDIFNNVKPVLPTLVINFDAIQANSANVTSSTIPESQQIWGFWNWLTFIYIIGCVVILSRLIYQAIYLHAISRISKTIKDQNITVVLMEKAIIPFSYFNKIFIPKAQFDEISVRNIIEHERSHLKQYHFIDIIVIQLVTIIQWFNPFAWFIERSVKEIHEFLADKTVLRSGYDQGRYQALLVNQAMGGPVFTITNQFNQSLIKKRIIMMTKMKSPNWARFKALLILPLIALLTLAFSNQVPMDQPFSNSGKESLKSSEAIKITGTVTSKETGKPIAGVNVIVQGTTSGTITSLEGKYEIVVDNGATLVFSFVGYQIVSIPIGEKTSVDVQLETEAITIDFSKKNSLIASQETNHTNEKSPIHSPKDPLNPGTFVVVEELPSYPGGTDALKKFIYDNLQYPADAKKNKIQGKVLVNFIVDQEGKIVNPKVMRGTSPSLDAEALRVTKLVSGWKPGKQGGKAISCRVIVPIEFKL